MNLADGLRISSWRFPKKIAAVFEDRQITYEQLNNRANQLAHAMIQKRFKRQEKISIIMYNNIEFLEIYHALARVALVSVPVNFRLVGSELEYIINNSDSIALFIGVELFDKINPKNIPLIKPETFSSSARKRARHPAIPITRSFWPGSPPMNPPRWKSVKMTYFILAIPPARPAFPRAP